jgi:hypothetical protein
VTVEASGTAVVDEALFSGWIRISSPIDLGVRDGNNRISLDERKEALIAPGPHDLQFENRALGFLEVRHVEVKPGETTTIAIEPPLSKVTVKASEPAEVTVDGARVGQTPLINHPVNIGVRTVTVKSASGAQRQITLTVTTTPAHLDVDFSTR